MERTALKAVPSVFLTKSYSLCLCLSRFFRKFILSRGYICPFYKDRNDRCFVIFSVCVYISICFLCSLRKKRPRRPLILPAIPTEPALTLFDFFLSASQNGYSQSALLIAASQLDSINMPYPSIPSSLPACRSIRTYRTASPA